MTKEKIEIGKERESLIPWKSRPEYAEGRLKLNFEHIFDNGEKLIVQEDENGIAAIVFKKNNEVIFDFANLLPKDTQFITPSFLNNYIEQAEKQGFSYNDTRWEHYDQDLTNLVLDKGEWECSINSKYILIGDWHDNTQNIAMVLHEIGHSYQNVKQLFKDFKEIERLITNLSEQPEESINKETIVSNVDKIKQVMVKHSESERGAWAYAIRKLREIQKKTSINLKSFFPTTESIISFANSSLCIHRHYWERLGYLYEGQAKGPSEKSLYNLVQKEILKHFDKPVRE